MSLKNQPDCPCVLAGLLRFCRPVCRLFADALSSTLFLPAYSLKQNRGRKEALNRKRGTVYRPARVIQYQLPRHREHDRASNCRDRSLRAAGTRRGDPDGWAAKAPPSRLCSTVAADLDPENDGLEWSTLPPHAWSPVQDGAHFNQNRFLRIQIACRSVLDAKRTLWVRAKNRTQQLPGARSTDRGEPDPICLSQIKSIGTTNVKHFNHFLHALCKRDGRSQAAFGAVAWLPRRLLVL